MTGVESMFAYHEATKHTVEKLRASPHTLDWANMPDPFRHYDGAPLVDLPASPPAPEALVEGAPGDVVLSSLLYYSAAISAAKIVPSTGYRYALRVNPSSGNLHPTEFHFVTRGLQGWDDGLYHYRPSSHMAERRLRGALPYPLPEGAVVFILTSIAWREAWKYRDRAYRYCLLDTGHAWGCLALAAAAMGCATSAHGHFADRALARAIGVDDEWPMLIVSLAKPAGPPEPGAVEWTAGAANVLSAHFIAHPRIDAIHEASSLDEPIGAAPRALAPGQGKGDIALPAPAPAVHTFSEAARRRRSALDFRGGAQSIPVDQLAALLDAAAAPMDADFAGRFVSLYLYVHRVEGLEPGVYRHWPGTRSLEKRRSGDQRLVAAGLSLGQDLAGNCCVAFSMVADLERAARTFGNRAYRYSHFEAGQIGQRLYIAAERRGLSCTGIGAFYDDAVHRYLEIEPAEGQVIYHFACGYAVHDPRLDAQEIGT